MTQFQILNWTPDGHCSNYRTITSLLKDVVEVQMKTGNNPILVHCRCAHNTVRSYTLQP